MEIYKLIDKMQIKKSQYKSIRLVDKKKNLSD